MDLSVIIPSRHERYLKRTIEDVLEKASCEIEVVAVLDGYWETADQVVNDARVRYLHNGRTMGMRASINRGVAMATGKYILKCDAHVMFAAGFDQALIKHHKNKRIQVPTRRRLDPEGWAVIEDGRPDINYLKLNEKYRGVEDRRKNEDPQLAKKKIDDIEAFQGSCWFMRRRYYGELGLLDAANWGPMGHEAQEIYFKARALRGHVVRNKHTWYAHWHKTSDDLTFNSDRSQARKFMPQFIKAQTKKHYRVKEGFKRRDLAGMFRGYGAEVGVRQGKYSEIICQEGRDIQLLSVDPYGLPYRDRRSATHGIKLQNQYYEEAKARLGKYDCRILKMESMQAVAEIDYEALDFVYIDGSHQFDYVMCDIIEWAKRVKPGGIVSGHDYYKFRDGDVVAAVDIYCRIHKIDFHLTDEYTPSWWFIKE